MEVKRVESKKWIMFNVCPACGMYHVDKEIIRSKSQTLAICPNCSYEHPFLSLPLLFLSGPSGVGKSTIGLRLQRSCKELVVIETDLFWIKPLEDDQEMRWELMLRVAKNIMQAGKPVLMVGTALPQHHTKSIEKRYFASMNYLAMVCEDAQLRARLEARPDWRNCSHEGFIQRQLAFNQWLKDNHHLRTPKIELLDNSELSEEATHEQVLNWIRLKIS